MHLKADVPFALGATMQSIFFLFPYSLSFYVTSLKLLKMR